MEVRNGALGKGSHREGLDTVSVGDYSHAEGKDTQSHGESSHSEGITTDAFGLASHSEGTNTIACGSSSHSEGVNTTAYSEASHSEGVNTVAVGFSSHAEGLATEETMIIKEECNVSFILTYNGATRLVSYASIEVYDISGQVVFSGQTNSKGYVNFTLPCGVYKVRILNFDTQILYSYLHGVNAWRIYDRQNYYYTDVIWVEKYFNCYGGGIFIKEDIIWGDYYSPDG